MPPVYFTPASISYLAQLILSGVICAYLFFIFQKRNQQNWQTRLILAFFLTTAIFISLLFFETVLVTTPRLYFLYFENLVLALALLFFLQFAYYFPALYPQHNLERLAALGLSLLYVLYEALIAVYRLGELVGKHQMHFRPPEPDYLMGILFIWIPAAFLRQCLAADTRSLPWFARIWKPGTQSARVAREFATIYSMLVVLGAASLLRTELIVSELLYNILLSIGILIVLWLFASRYVGFIPGGVPVLVKISAITLTLLLATLGWVISPAHARTYPPQLTELQTLRSTQDWRAVGTSS